ncbi:MAG TPA: class D sortase [Candidatus Acidoferrum sp.]|nr:class D sortase [Candidatus Acidoferrum sp.]
MEWSRALNSRTRWERLLFVTGILLLSFYVVARVHGLLSSRWELQRFWKAQRSANETGAWHGWQDYQEPDVRLWSPKRIAAYESALHSSVPSPMGVLRIASLSLEVPILDGTDDFTLNRAVGHIEGTAEPGQRGNIGIAGHRDGFFRVLKDIRQGDVIELITTKENTRYLVDQLLVVSPQDVSVLQPGSTASLTLVTCYPFYFVGSAPQRFIVHASAEHPTDLSKR